jgi:hypothetical protein
LAEVAFALQDFGEVKGHESRNCFSKRSQAGWSP